MDAKTLIGIVETRIASSDGNPTSKSFLYEVHKALQRLNAYESNDKSINDLSEQEVKDILDD